ncbi:hypothetical protein PM082_004834 [Marasmius tenuissimus]|nr:hypothetical protein PM082_004834 [Marasmius tenuissimus]
MNTPSLCNNGVTFTTSLPSARDFSYREPGKVERQEETILSRNPNIGRLRGTWRQQSRLSLLAQTRGTHQQRHFPLVSSIHVQSSSAFPSSIVTHHPYPSYHSFLIPIPTLRTIKGDSDCNSPDSSPEDILPVRPTATHRLYNVVVWFENISTISRLPSPISTSLNILSNPTIPNKEQIKRTLKNWIDDD